MIFSYDEHAFFLLFIELAVIEIYPEIYRFHIFRWRQRSSWSCKGELGVWVKRILKLTEEENNVVSAIALVPMLFVIMFLVPVDLEFAAFLTLISAGGSYSCRLRYTAISTGAHE